jgi:molybdopterin-guanine dinucleotide biosynthesis protein A
MHPDPDITVPRREITAVILAGGRARRMGGEDKGLIPLEGRPMVAHVITALQPQVGELMVNANRNLDRYAEFGYRVITDAVGDFSGPLAGMASAMQSSRTRYVLTAPCDSPLVPDDLAGRLYSTLTSQHAEIAVAHDGERVQPVFSLLRRDLVDSVLAFLAEGERKIDRWFADHKTVTADFSDKPDAFMNVNTDQERVALEKTLRRGGAPLGQLA